MFQLHKIIRQDALRHVYMCTLVLLSTIGFNVMRGMRETVVFQFGKNGALYTPFIRMMCILPISALLFVYYLYVKRRSSTLHAYYAIVLPILTYFVAYATFTESHVVMMTQHSAWLQAWIDYYPPIEFIAGILVHWDKTLYYVFCEAWGPFTLVILFWQIANETYTESEAKTLYPVFSMLGGAGIIISALLIGQMGHHPNITLLTTQVICAIGLINCWLVTLIWQGRTEYLAAKPKHSIGLRQGIKLALTTPHILYLTLCIISFSILCNIYENSVRNIILQHYQSEQAVFKFWGSFFMGKGLLVVSANILSKFLLRRVGWFYVAITTPIVSIASIHIALSIPSLNLVSIFGQTQYLLSLLALLLQLNFAVKYAFFDPTKEMAYIPLTDAQKTYGKTVADGLGSRAGNIGSGLVQTIAIFAASGSDFLQVAPYLLVICSALSAVWIWAISNLCRSYNTMTSTAMPLSQSPSLQS